MNARTFVSMNFFSLVDEIALISEGRPHVTRAEEHLFGNSAFEARPYVFLSLRLSSHLNPLVLGRMAILLDGHCFRDTQLKTKSSEQSMTTSQLIATCIHTVCKKFTSFYNIVPYFFDSLACYNFQHNCVRLLAWKGGMGTVNGVHARKCKGIRSTA